MTYCHTWFCSGEHCKYCYAERQRHADGGLLDAYLAGDAAYVQAAQMGYTFVGTTF